MNELLRLALSGQKIKKTNTQLPPLTEDEAELCVTDAFSRLMTSISRRNAVVMEIVLDHKPNSNVVLFLMILMLQRSIIDMLRKRSKGVHVSAVNADWINRMDSEMTDGNVGALEWLVDQVQPDWHGQSSVDDSTSARADLIRLFDRAVAAGKFNVKYQNVFKGMLDGFALGIDDDAIAKSLELDTQDYQRLKYKIVQKLKSFAGL